MNCWLHENNIVYFTHSSKSYVNNIFDFMNNKFNLEYLVKD